jgi:hypothetical protein
MTGQAWKPVAFMPKNIDVLSTQGMQQVTMPPSVSNRCSQTMSISSRDSMCSSFSESVPGQVQDVPMSLTESAPRPSSTKSQTPSAGECRPHTKPSAKSAAAAADAASIRSERARNAANSRHSRAKDCSPSSSSSSLSDSQRNRQDIDREKNRIAAARCRRKKRAKTEALDAEVRSAVAENNYLKREQRELRDQLTYWRMLALQHVDGQSGCFCDAIQRYNSDQAFRAVCEIDAHRRDSFSLSMPEAKTEQAGLLIPAS